MPAAAFDLIMALAGLASSPAQAFKAAASGLAEVLEANYQNEQWEDRMRGFPYVEKLAANHGSLLGFIEHYVLDPVHTSELDQLKRDDCVTLITIHSAKGTGAPVCYIPGVSPGTYPLTRCIGDFDEAEEERRVLYVAITRACDELIGAPRVERTMSATSIRCATGELPGVRCRAGATPVLLTGIYGEGD